MGYTIGGIACLVYAAFVYYVAIAKPPAMIKIIKWKLSKNMSDRAAVILCYVLATIALAGGIVLIILGKR
jgi:hypothetical protein